MSRSQPHHKHSAPPQTPPPHHLQNMIAILNYLGDGVLMTDEEGRVIAWNDALAQLTGCDAAQVLGQYIWDVQGRFAADPARSEETAASARQALQSFLQRGAGERQDSLVEQEIRAVSGEIKTVQYRAFAIPAPAGGWRLGVILRDISRQKAAIERAQESAQLLERRVAERAARLEALTQELEREIEERRRAESELHAQRQFLRTVIDSNPNLMTVKDRRGRMLLANQAMAEFYGAAVEDLIGKTERDFGEDPELSEQLSQRLEQVFVSGEPLLIEEESLHDDKGRLHILQTRIIPMRTPQGELQALCVSTDITRRVEREREMRAISAISAALRQAKNRAEMLPIILSEVCSMLEGRGAMLVRRDPPGDGLVVEMGFGELDQACGERLPPGQGISAQALASGQPFITDHLLQERNAARPWALKEDLAALCVPYSHGEERSGALWVVRQAPFTPAEARLLATVANIVGNALHRAALHEETARRLQQLNALRAIDLAISVNRDLHSTLDTLLKEVTAQLGADAADILLYEPLTGQLKYAAGIGFRSNFIQFTALEMGEGFAGRSALQRRPLHIPDMRVETDSFSRSLLLSGEEFIGFSCVPLIVRQEVKGVLEVFSRQEARVNEEWLRFLETLAGQAAIAVDNAELLEGLQRSNTELTRAYDETIEGWSKALELRDLETRGHSQRMPEMTVALARRMGIASEEELIHIRRGALLHDIGKMGIPDAILLKPGALDAQEWEIMRRHPVYANEMLAAIPFLRPARAIPYCHHERWNGSGYPRGLKGEDIPLEARIFAVVDVWDALRSARPYRPAWSEEETRRYLSEQAGRLFDPQAVSAFFDLFS